MQKLTMLMTVPCVAVLSACGGGGGGNDGPVMQTTPTYETLTSKKATTSTLGGVAIFDYKGSARYKETELVQVSGNLTHDTGALSLKSGDDRMKAPNGPDKGLGGRNRVYSDRSNLGTIVKTSTKGLSGKYQYVTPYIQVAPSNRRRGYDGVVGIVTATSDMPKTAKATYTGDAYGNYQVDAGNLINFSDLEKGKSTVKADFGSGKVNVEMSDFKNGANKPVNRITANNMVISGNGFSGGNITAYKDENQVNLTGPKTSKQAAGAFFGYDAAKSVPDEVGGAVLISGNHGYITGRFIAD